MQDASPRYCSQDVKDYHRIVAENLGILAHIATMFSRELEAKDDESTAEMHGDSWGRYLDRVGRRDGNDGINSRTGADGVVVFFEPTSKDKDPTQKIQKRDADIGTRNIDSYR